MIITVCISIHKQYRDITGCKHISIYVYMILSIIIDVVKSWIIRYLRCIYI